MGYSNLPNIEALHRELALKYENHFPRIQKIWRASNQAKREHFLRANTSPLFNIPNDSSTNRPCSSTSLCPDWNVLDITEAKSDYLLDMLTHRATKSLEEQFWEDVNGEPITEASNDELWKPHPWDTYTYFSQEFYGDTICISEKTDEEILNRFDDDIEAGILLPIETGKLVLCRQGQMLANLLQIVNAILDGTSQRKRRNRGSGKKRDAQDTEEATPAFRLRDLIDYAVRQKEDCEVQLSLLRTQPAVLYSTAEAQFLSRPERVPEEYQHGDIEPCIYVKATGRDVFDVVHTKVRGVAFWRSVESLLCIIEKFSNEELRKQKAINELFQMCERQFSRAQKSAEHHVATGMGWGWFTCDRSWDLTYLRMEMCRAELILTDLPLHYLLGLFHTCNISDAMCQLRKLGSIYKSDPWELERLSERESHSLYELCSVATFLQKLHAAFPAVDNGQECSPGLGKDLFVPGIEEVDLELEKVKREAFSSTSFSNLDDPLKPDMAEKTLEELDNLVREKTGTTMDILYQEQVKEMVRTLEIPKRIGHAIEMFWLGHPEGRDPAKRAETRRKRDERRASQPLSDSSTPASGCLDSDSTSVAQEADPRTAGRLLALFEKLQVHI
ncbi:hypothetical protein FPOAC2_11675 [Fusarium poae]|uniref:Uncharacterized protein n=1 Tax=Fusarium poae TaxID=36050 RepID=A0A1B8AE99_FUSPO|nr:hypothetical protein FPOAC1_011368 [Fusarium poae]KAG8666558.1 hypothetical protein FPOAC1_011368 [Fusarium poae]OBS18816.1 hypothetical protein FPOA_10543 [Fusarium poae]